MQFITGLVALTATLISTVSCSPLEVRATAVSPSYLNDTEFKRVMLEAHNFYRTQHGVGPLTWNEKQANVSANYTAKCVFKHSGTPKVGENLAISYPDVGAAVTAWASERNKYNYTNPTFSLATGHFTQLVWKGTGTVGCARTACGKKGYLIFCQYVKQGNMTPASKYFPPNVLKQSVGNATDLYVYKPAGTKKTKRDNDENDAPVLFA